MMIPYTVRPLDPWIGPRTRYPEQSRFRTDWRTTLAELGYELERLGATAFVLQLDVSEWDLRKDGGIRANARPASSEAIRINFTAAKKGPLTFACDRYDDWHDNVRAVAKTLEALRAVDRYGVTATGEQYRGWTAITKWPAEMTREQAAEFIAHWATHGTPFEPDPAGVLANPEVLKETYYRAAKRVHPDVTGDDGDTMARLNAARDLLAKGA